MRRLLHVIVEMLHIPAYLLVFFLSGLVFVLVFLSATTIAMFPRTESILKMFSISLHDK